MGCDIHAYIDYEEEIRSDYKIVSCFAADVELGRNYDLFALMAGVRFDKRTDSFKPMFQPRGLPALVSWQVQDAYSLRVWDETEDGICTLADAKKWIKRGQSHWVNGEHTLVSNPDWHSASFLSTSELEQVQSAYSKIERAEVSYFVGQKPKQEIGNREFYRDLPITKIEELKTDWGTVEYYVELGNRKPNGPNVNLAAIIAAMAALDKGEGMRSRLVFWFDN